MIVHMRILFKIGDRVAFTDGAIGHIEEVDEFFCDVRWLTPNNVPSCVNSSCRLEHLIKVPDNVVPMQRNKAWWNQSRQFCSVVEGIVQDLLIKEV